MEQFFLIYNYGIYFYALAITFSYVILAVLGYFNIKEKKRAYTKFDDPFFFMASEMVPSIAIVAPAYNEEVVIVDSVNSLLGQEYPNFEVVIVNDGSKDHTLPLLIEHFFLEEIPFEYKYKVPCRPVKRIFKSTNPLYSRLTVVDKINGGTKADAVNAGVNYISSDYFINTDVDCILAPNTMKKVITPVLNSSVEVIAVGATLRMSNGCDIENGVMKQVRPPRELVSTFQETEYMRSYLLAKMGWGMLNAIPNVSGGFGLVKTSVVVNVGGYDPLSHAEDMDMTLRMCAYMLENGYPYRIEQIPDSCCWTEGPSNVKILRRQRTRWGRGLAQIFIVHHRLILRPRYKKIGLVVLPISFLFEFLAPIIEFTGALFMIFLLLTGQINFDTFFLMLFYVYIVGVSVSAMTILYDISVKQIYKNFRDYLRLMIFSGMEAFVYHPMIVLFSLQGYVQYFTKKSFKWGEMTRKGFGKKTPSSSPPPLTDPTT